MTSEWRAIYCLVQLLIGSSRYGLQLQVLSRKFQQVSERRQEATTELIDNSEIPAGRRYSPKLASLRNVNKKDYPIFLF